ncbi:MAG TPA: hypothetical protein VGB07_27825 [Blastocatellia bacterium]
MNKERQSQSKIESQEPDSSIPPFNNTIYVDLGPISFSWEAMRIGRMPASLKVLGGFACVMPEMPRLLVEKYGGGEFVAVAFPLNAQISEGISPVALFHVKVYQGIVTLQPLPREILASLLKPEGAQALLEYLELIPVPTPIEELPPRKKPGRKMLETTAYAIKLINEEGYSVEDAAHAAEKKFRSTLLLPPVTFRIEERRETIAVAVERQLNRQKRTNSRTNPDLKRSRKSLKTKNKTGNRQNSGQIRTNTSKRALAKSSKSSKRKRLRSDK